MCSKWNGKLFDIFWPNSILFFFFLHFICVFRLLLFMLYICLSCQSSKQTNKQTNNRESNEKEGKVEEEEKKKKDGWKNDSKKRSITEYFDRLSDFIQKIEISQCLKVFPLLCKRNVYLSFVCVPTSKTPPGWFNRHVNSHWNFFPNCACYTDRKHQHRNINSKKRNNNFKWTAEDFALVVPIFSLTVLLC